MTKATESLFQFLRSPKFWAWAMLLTTAGMSVASLIWAGISNPWLLIPGVLFGAMFVCALIVTEDVVG